MLYLKQYTVVLENKIEKVSMRNINYVFDRYFFVSIMKKRRGWEKQCR